MNDQVVNKKMLYLVSQNKELCDIVSELWGQDNMLEFQTAGSALEFLLIDPPEILIIDISLPDMSGLELLRLVKEENVYRQLSTLLYIEDFNQTKDFDWSSLDVDDFISPPFSLEMLKARIELGIQRSSRTLDASPLTHLPGNTSIINTIKERIQQGEDFALGYCDLDYFKSYNDKYGFSRGDEVLMMTARLVVTTVRSFKLKNAFVGHVGGDDFVFVMPSKYAELACEHIIASFDAIIPQFYDAKDREQKGITSIDRQGILRKFPFMSISIAVVVNKDSRLEHYGQVSQIASALKSQVKSMPGSSFLIDRRPILI
ncbi:GGDEF domain-containing protein [Desulfovibrio litoralis]|uniref:diguanylate cyclase n=1 Tax=Desulfovibrio litoralis DSM 11393 TaxID=1121455 RepID=A0A1M7RVD5_9BACT|nr:diguanylate cyclase [Desulfovibrio litoralis]SHN50265.1 diguanylate cyclase (GGDEF) domain-containing protein [Desulfovibrio litoralis DSM 11393]